MFQKLLRSLALIIAAVILGTLLLALAYSIPYEYIDRNVADASKIIRQEGGYPVVSEYATSTLDNWTDSIMLMEAAFPTDGNAFRNAMLVQRYGDDSYPYGSVSIPYEEFPHYYETGEYAQIIDYPNYWHGYLVFLKPLLAVLGFSQIRILNGVLQALLTLSVCAVLWKKKKSIIVPYLLCVGLLMPEATAKCMQFSTCFYIFSIACLAVLLSDRLPQLRWYIFLCTGIATAYFDFLTYPLSTFGMPAIMCLLLDKKESTKEKLKNILLFSIAWIMGYALMWLGKLAIGSLILGSNLFVESIDHVNYWASDWDSSILYVFYFCLSSFARTPAMIIAVVFAVIQFVRIMREIKKGRCSVKELSNYSLPFIVIAVLPFVYYSIMVNPMTTHGGLFGHKALIITAFAGLSLLSDFTVDKHAE